MTKIRIYKYIKCIIYYFGGEKMLHIFGSEETCTPKQMCCFSADGHILCSMSGGPWSADISELRHFNEVFKYKVFKLEEARRNMCENF